MKAPITENSKDINNYDTFEDTLITKDKEI
jgi:hypothetical protein